MRVLIPLEHLDAVGGAQRSVLELSEALSARGYQFVVLYRVSGSFIERWSKVSVSLIKAPMWCSPRRPVRSLLGTLLSVRALRNVEFDAVFCNLFANLPFSILVAQKRRIPLIMWICEPAVGGPRRTIYRWLLRRVDRLAFVSEFQRRDYERVEMVAPDARVIRNGVDTRHYRPPSPVERTLARSKFHLSDSDRAVVYLGRLDPTKGLETLFHAIRQLSDPQLVPVVAGAESEWRRGNSRYVSQLVRGAPPSVRFVGRVDDPVPLLWAADLVVMPSTWQEPLGRVQLEAMACGVPVIATDVGGIPETFPDELATFLVPPEDAHSLATRISQIWHEGPGAGWSSVVRRTAVERFDLVQVADRADLLFKSVHGTA